MKKDIHPQLHPVVFVDMSDGTEFQTMATMTSEETKKIDGVEHYVIKVDISSASHPFYTGKQKLVDTAGRVEKFKAKMAKAEAIKGTSKGDDHATAGDDDNASDDTAVEETKEEAKVEEVATEEAPAEEVKEDEVAEEAPAEESTEEEAA
jgi:large subunit ribosomal protein L31